ncbi:hypothetical protein [Archangium sp.]|uniref:hypothetical protein n=1 Tax=Archangium sp. TaxID=1872627 RepID=UPI00389B3811
MATTPPSLESLRRQLEGRWESIEQARECYAALTRRLASFQWKRALRGHPELLAQTREQEAELTEVLAYMEHRARLEGWTPDHPGLGVLHELRAWRTKLEALARKRLAGSLAQQGDSFQELLEQLEALALAPEARPLQPDEPVLLEGWMPAWPGPGRFWLTPERLVWRPWFFGEPVQLEPESLSPENIAVLPRGFFLLAEGRRGFTLLPSVGQALKLKALLELCRQLAQHRREQPQVFDLITPPMYWHHPDYPADRRWGLGVFGPHGMTFLPVREPTLRERLKRWVGFEVRRPEPELRRLEGLVERLRRLPSDTFNQALGELTRAQGGKHYWPATGLVRLPDAGQDFRLRAPAQVLVVPASEQSGALHTFLERYPPQGEDAVSRKAPASWWWRHSKEKVGIVLGAALSYPLAFMLPSAVSWLAYLAGHGLSFWSSARFAKAKGYPWWLGLVLAMGCSPIGTLLLFFIPERKKSLGPFTSR